MNYGSVERIAALKALAMRWTQGKVVAEQWWLQLLSMAPPSWLFVGVPNASRHVAEVIVTPPDHMNTSAESLHYELLLRCK